MSLNVDGGASPLRAAVLAGLLGAVLQAMPFLGRLNDCCCALTLLAGMFAAWIVRSDSRGAAGTGACATAGFGAGIVAALVGVPLHAILGRLAFGVARLEASLAAELAQSREAAEQFGMPPPAESLAMLESLQRALRGLDFGGWLIAATLGIAVVQALFGTLGGLLGSGLFRGGAPRPPAGVHPWSIAPGAPAAVPPPRAGAGPEDPPPPELPQATEPAATSELPQAPIEQAPREDEPHADAEIPLHELPLLPPRPEDGAQGDEGGTRQA